MEELKLKKLKKDKKTNIVIGALALVAVTSAVTYLGTRAKYQTIDSIPLARGTVTYKKADLEVVAVLQETSNSSEAFETKGTGENTKYYKKATSIPSSGFTLNTTYSSCDNGAVFGPSETTGLYVDKITASGTKCTFYFDEIKGKTINNLIATADKTSITTSAGFGVKEEGAGGLYEFDGMTAGSKTQFYRGAITNNYVKLGTSGNETYWRIVRFDEEGNIRLIYDGTGVHNNGEQSNDRQLTTNYDGTNMIEYMYHSNTTEYHVGVRWENSPIKPFLDTWLVAFENRLSQKEINALTTGEFCNDMSIATTDSNTKFYGAHSRLRTNKTPSFRCDGGEVTTSRIGILSADEYSFAGGGGEGEGNENRAFYLYTGVGWWTITPFYSGKTGNSVLGVNLYGRLNEGYTGNQLGIRPVITLKGDTKFDPDTNGTKNNPYTIAN